MSYTRIPNGFIDHLPKFTPSAVVVYLAVVRRIGANEDCFPTISTLQTDTGLARASICRAIDELRNKDALVITGGQGTLHHYSLTASSKSELVDAKVVQNLNFTSSKSELQLVQNLDANKKQEKETLNNISSEPPAASVPTDSILVFPTVGKGPKEFHLTQFKINEYRESFPGVDVLAECRMALQWCRDNTAKRKTAKGMPAFLTRWLSKQQNSGYRSVNGNGNNGQSAPTLRRKLLTPD